MVWIPATSYPAIFRIVVPLDLVGVDTRVVETRAPLLLLGDQRICVMSGRVFLKGAPTAVSP